LAGKAVIMKNKVIHFITLIFILSLFITAQEPSQGKKSITEGLKGMVSSSHPFVSKTMIDVLKNGGNAVDAVITAVLLQPVFEPQMSSISGGFSLLYYHAETKKFHYLNASCDHARKNKSRAFVLRQPSLSDLRSPENMPVAVPGTIKGLWAAYKKFGTKQWEEYFTPAVNAAREGFNMYDFLYSAVNENLKTLSASESASQIFLAEGSPVGVGEHIRQPELAETLNRLAETGPDYFYKGVFAQKFIKYAQMTGSELTLEDLEDYKVRWIDPLRFSYRGHTIIGAPPPDSGGLYLNLALNIMETVDLKKMGHYSESAETLFFMANALGRVSRDIYTHIKDPLGFQMPTEILMSKEYARMISLLIQNTRPKPSMPAEFRSIEKTNVPGPEAGSNHLVVVDSQGNIATMIHTVFGKPFGSGIFVDGVCLNCAGIFLGSSRGEGRRVIAPLSPVIILKDNKPWIALGTPGNPPPVEVEVITNLLDFDMDIYEAIDAPRFWPLMENTLQVESRIDDKILDNLRVSGINVMDTGNYDWHFGSLQIVRIEEDKMYGAADPRRCGLSLGFN
jgi:gamma-glutamyltranspeptidase/glutathione hydrolase